MEKPAMSAPAGNGAQGVLETLGEIRDGRPC
jgi:hypothetical protein